jgi:hypothetical protein
MKSPTTSLNGRLFKIHDVAGLRKITKPDAGIVSEEQAGFDAPLVLIANHDQRRRRRVRISVSKS